MALDRFGIQLEALTRGEADLNRLEQLLNRVGNSAQRAESETASSISGFGNTLRDGIANPAGAAQQAWDALLGKLGTTGAVVGAVTGVVGGLAAATFALAKSFADTYEAQANNAMRLGVTIQQYGVLSQVSKEAGLSGDVLVSTMRGLSKALSDGSEESAKQVKAIKEIGVSTHDALGVMRPMQEILLGIADKLGAIQNPAERAEKALTLLGRSGLEALPMMNAELREQVRIVSEANVALNAYEQTMGRIMDKQLDEFDRRWEAFKKKFKFESLKTFLFFTDFDSYTSILRAQAMEGQPAPKSGPLPSSVQVLNPFFETPESRRRKEEMAAARKKAAEEQARRWAANKGATIDQLIGLPRSRIPGLGLSGIDRSLEMAGFGTGYGLPTSTSSYQFDRAAANAAASIEQFEQQERLSQQALQAQIQLLQLMAGPGGELEAARQIRDLRLSTARDVLEAQQANLDYAVQEAQIRKSLRDEARQTGGSIFDSLLRGGAGVRSWASSFGLGIGRTAFSNLYGATVGGMTGRFSLPGVGTAANPTLLGKVFAGTPFGADPMSAAAGTQMSAAQIQLQAATTFAGAVGMGAAGGASLAGLSSGFGLLPMFGGSTRGSGLPASVQMLNPFYGQKSGGGLMTSLGATGILAGGALGVYGGIQQGGLQGGLMAAGSAGGALAGMAGLLGGLGAAGPVGAAIAIGAMVASAFIGDPKQKRSEALRTETERRQYEDVSGMDYAYDTQGRRYDYNRRGDLRVVVEVNAMDSKSFVDHKQDIGEAVRQALGTYQPLIDDVRAAVMPGA